MVICKPDEDQLVSAQKYPKDAAHNAPKIAQPALVLPQVISLQLAALAQQLGIHSRKSGVIGCDQ